MASPESTAGRVFSIPSGAPFLETLAEALVGGELGFTLPVDDPLALARCTVYLPTRRAVRAFRAILGRRVVETSGRAALLLPRLVPLGDADEAEVLLSLSADAEPPPPVMGALERRLKLTRLVRAWADRVNRSLLHLPEGRALLPRSLAEAFALSSDLAAIIDEFGIHDRSFEALDQVDLHRLDTYWQLTARFLAIAGREWPRELAQGGFIEAADRDRLLVEGMIRHWAGGANDPVVAAGSTGSIPTTARLLTAIAGLPKGAVVLPGLDLAMDDASLAAVQAEAHGDEASHPQAILTQLVARLGVTHDAVISLGRDRTGGAHASRRLLLTEAFRPVATTPEWASIEERLPAIARAEAFRNVSIVQAPDERLEALAIAGALRRALEKPDRTAALVTPDRRLAERVVAELRRWDIDIDDTAGLPLQRTAAGGLALSVLKIARPGLLAQDLLTLLAQPLAGFGLTPDQKRDGAAALEIGALRGAPPVADIETLLAVVRAIPRRVMADHRAPAARRRLSADQINAAIMLVERLQSAMAPLSAMTVRMPVTAWAAAHREAVLLIAARETEGTWLDDRDDTALLFELFAEMERATADAPLGDLDDYAALFEEVAAEKTLRVGHRQHPRLKVMGLLEARLLEADTVILGGLKDEVWPPLPRADAFLNRALRLALDLPSPERRIGQTAHDFVQAAMAPRVILTWPMKAGTAQSIPSRFLQRLAAVTGAAIWNEAVASGNQLLQQVAGLDRPPRIEACKRPAPKPAAARQPQRLSVTEIETLYRDPYAIFARHVLGLDALEPLESALGHSDRGRMLHEITARFADVFAVTPPESRPKTLDRIAREVFAPVLHEPEVAQFWWPSWQRLAPELLAWEERRRTDMTGVGTEAGARWSLKLPDGTGFLLTARADRIELLQDGSYRMIDFKSGTIPRSKDIADGLAPQLTLQAAMAAQVPFGNLPPGPVSSAGYVRLKPEEILTSATKLDRATLEELSSAHVAGLRSALQAYRSGERGFVPRIVPGDARRTGDYDHLARVAEWSRDDGAGGEA